ncbi:ribonuclease H-like domain, reverse transcriptase, RNA-dependent DNA polymerase [Tanacetum coccineum]
METVNNTTVEDNVEPKTVNMDDSNVVVSNEDTMGVAKAINMDDFNVDKTMDNMLHMVHESHVNDCNVKSVSFANTIILEKSPLKVNFRKLESSNASTGEYEAMIPVSLVLEVKERLSNMVFGYFIEDVLENGPWMIRTMPNILNKWTPMTSLKNDNHKSVLIWVKMHDVPMVAFTADRLSIIATKVHNSLMLDSY